MQLFGTRYYTDPIHIVCSIYSSSIYSTNTGSTHLSWNHISSSLSSLPPHSWLGKVPPGKTGTVQISKDTSISAYVFLNWIHGCLQIPYPPVHFSFPPTTVTFFGEDLDGVSFLQWQLWTVPGWEVVPGSCYAEAPHAASCKTTEVYKISWTSFRKYFISIFTCLVFHEKTVTAHLSVH